mgnify:CR=1 FL=1
MVEASQFGRYICERTGIWTRNGMEWFGADDQPIPTPRSVTFHIWTIYSTFTTWVDIAAERIELRKPEVITAGQGSDQAARRVDIGAAG